MKLLDPTQHCGMHCNLSASASVELDQESLPLQMDAMPIANAGI